MNEYLLGVVGTVLFASVLQAILPSGKSTQLLQAILRIACITVILTPIVRFFVEWENLEGIFVESSIQGNEGFIQYCREQRIEDAESFIENDLEKRYSISCEVRLDWKLQEVVFGEYTEKEIFVEKIIVQTLNQSNSVLQREVETYLWDTYGVESSFTGAVDAGK
jgi:hypothetical protein